MKTVTKRLVKYCMILCLLFSGWYFFIRIPVVFPDLVGPIENSIISAEPERLSFKDFKNTDPNALALLVKDKNSAWAGLAFGLKSIGIPFSIVETTSEAIEHDVIMVYPALTGANTAPESLRALAEHVRNGGTLMAFSVIGGGMSAVFGFETSTEMPSYTQVEFSDIEFNSSFTSSRAESIISLSEDDSQEIGLSGISYKNPKHMPVAYFDDGSAAITHNFFDSDNGTGHAYAIGFELGHFILRATGGRFVQLADSYVNEYQPKIDTFLRFFAKVYQQGEKNAVLFSPTPMAADLTILMTHDIDFKNSIDNIPRYAEVEKNMGAPSTYFIQTKYLTDYNDEFFFEPEKLSIIQNLMNDGMEVASHTVSHSNEFSNMMTGNGQEQYPSYKPFVNSFTSVKNASITGELRISKFLLEQASGKDILSFRPGYLSRPWSLPQLLEATGYLYDSSITANQALTHLPYRVMHDRSYDFKTSIIEFPVTIEDEKGKKLGDRIDEAIAVAKDIAQYHGLVNVLVHTDILGHKLAFVEQFIAEFQNKAWFGTMAQYGNWWVAREAAQISINGEIPGSKTIDLHAPLAITGLTLQVPENWFYTSGVPGTFQKGNLVSLGFFQGNATVKFGISP